MKFSLLILGEPESSGSVATALEFAKAVLAEGHELYRIFFFHDAVNTGNRFSIAPQGPQDLPSQWQQLGEEHGLDMVLCISSAIRRGVVDQREAERYELPASNLRKGFELSGLGQWVDAMIHSDRIVSFGG